MLQLSAAGKRFGPRVLFENADWLITPNERTALVGANGTGKSTLLKVLAGAESLDYGSLQRTRGMTIGYLPQEGLALIGRSVFAECLSVFAELRSMEEELEILSTRLAEFDPSTPEYAAAADRFSFLDSHFRAHDGYALDAQVGTALGGLGFSKHDWSRQTEEFSGGWQMRIALAKLLLEKPDLLLLDEPTNHLDLPAIEWLERDLDARPAALVIISHDRRFLTNLSRVTVWLDRGKARRVERGFADFEAWRDDILAEEERKAKRKLFRKVKKKRRELVMAAQHKIARQISESFVGREIKVLVEGKADAAVRIRLGGEIAPQQRDLGVARRGENQTLQQVGERDHIAPCWTDRGETPAWAATNQAHCGRRIRLLNDSCPRSERSAAW